jgi:2-(1,2-epoxy-1,2-dihydrophenyl)acetyl-CoA isomerase
MSYESIAVESMGKIMRITLHREESFNALNSVMGRELLEAMEASSRDRDVRVVILTGAGKAFCAGGDTRAMKTHLDRGEDTPAAFFQGLVRLLHAVVTEMRRMPKPIIGAVNGAAAGGGFSLALACDLCLAAESARFTQAYTRLGLAPDGGSTYFLPRLLGPARAAALILLNPTLSSREALDLGLVNRVVPDDDLQDAAMELAAQLVEGPASAFARCKALLERTWTNSLEGQLEEERRGMMACSLTGDFREGVHAFFEKRPPRFTGE